MRRYDQYRALGRSAPLDAPIIAAEHLDPVIALRVSGVVEDEQPDSVLDRKCVDCAHQPTPAGGPSNECSGRGAVDRVGSDAVPL